MTSAVSRPLACSLPSGLVGGGEPRAPLSSTTLLHQRFLQQASSNHGGGGGRVDRARSSSPTVPTPSSTSGTTTSLSSSGPPVSASHHHHHHHHHHGGAAYGGSSSCSRSAAAAHAAALAGSSAGGVSASADGHLVRLGDQSEIGLARHQKTALVMDVCLLESELKKLHRWSLATKPTTKPVLQAIRCTASNCSCDCFHPGKSQARLCENCRHGWVAHALDKLGFRNLYNCVHGLQVELVQPSIAFDVASLMLFGTQALPIRLKILLDRLFSVLAHEDVLQVLHGFGWSYEDYARGYILQDTAGNVLDRWILATREEEPLILQQFLRFGETKAIAQQLLLQENGEKSEGRPSSVPRMGHDSDIKKFIERTNRAASGSALFKNAALLAHSSTCTSSVSTATSTVTTTLTNNNNNVIPISTMPTTSTAHTVSLNRPRPFRIPSSVSSTHSMSPPGAGSPVDCRSPAPNQSSSPLNKLQNMQPCDYRREKILASPDSRLQMGVGSLEPGCFISSNQHATPLSSPTSSAPTISSMHSMSGGGYANNLTSVTTGISDMSATDCDTDDDSAHAINLSRSSNMGMTTSHLHDSIYAARKVRHLRKSANPMRRRWNPMVLSTLTTNPATGKKRVQCHVCLKTFCDKGALKIHFSAVHLREMHKCTVEGCNMMFSSRRSRNRHSANPNPKLHTPNYRRKINPHDGRSANPYPLIPPSALLSLHNNNNHGLPSGGPLGGLDPDRPFISLDDAIRVDTKLSDDTQRKEDDSMRMSRESSMERHRRESRKSSPDVTALSRASPPPLQTVDGVLALTKKPRLISNFEEKLLHHQLQRHQHSQNHLQHHHHHHHHHHQQQQTHHHHQLQSLPQYRVQEDGGEADVSNGAEEGMNLSLKDQGQDALNNPNSNNNNNNNTPTASKQGVRKRKSMNPTRCTAVTSDDDLEYVTTDDSSSDTYIDHLDENGLLNSKSDDDDDDDDLLSSDDLGDDSKDYFYRNHLFKKRVTSPETNKSNQQAPSRVPPPDSPKPSIPSPSRPPDLKKEDAKDTPEVKENRDAAVEQSKAPASPSPVKEEPKSQMRNGPSEMEISENPLRHLESLSMGAFTNIVVSGGIRGHFGPTVPTSSGVSFHAPGLGLASSASSGEERPRSSEVVSLSNNPVSNICQNSSDHESYSEQMSLLPAFRDASLVGSVEIPVDKENPRRCTACGKIFQNHFGVKTHYQNVHLKLMHKCTVEGCNAAFPSKRSRDRHSANLNLHRKLLSTSSDKNSPFLDKSAMFPYHSAGAQLRDEFFSRLYDPQGLQPLNFADLYPGRIPPCNPDGLVAFPNHLGPLPFHHAFMTSASAAHLTDGLGLMGAAGLGMAAGTFLPSGPRSGKDSPSSSLTTSPSPQPASRPSSPKSFPFGESERHPEEESADPEPMDNHHHHLPCEFCSRKFRDTDALRHHYETCHARELMEKARESRAAEEESIVDDGDKDVSPDSHSVEEAGKFPTEIKIEDDEDAPEEVGADPTTSSTS